MDESDLENSPGVSQLSEAVAKFLTVATSFDDIAKGLIENLQTPIKVDVVQVNQVTSEPPPAPSTPAFAVPFPRNAGFVGRSESLSQLFGLWRPRQKGRIAVSGLGGVG